MEVNELIREAAKKLETPFLVLDIEQVKKNYIRLKNSMKKVDIFYAVKANSHIEILKALRDLGSSFDVASVGEIDKLLSIGVSPKRMSFGNPIKKEKDIEYAWKLGIEYFSVDSEMEVEKVARRAPGAKVYARIATSSNDSDWPLSGKFGTDIDHVISILKWANRNGLVPYGISFHVGSQSYNKYKWQEAILEASVVFNKLMKNGIELKMLNLGGGIPVKHTKPIPTVEEIGEVVDESIQEYLWKHKDLMIITEPGRSMVGDAGILVSKVILKSRKGAKQWVYLDVGVFHGLMETIENFQYEIQVEGKSYDKTGVFTLAGPTCDSVDTIYEDILLPADIDYEDIVYFINAGAYTVEYGSSFNGIEPPKVYTIDELKELIK
ncbi:ornithine decarboxylase [Marinitoga sp. 1135]|uniref:ornithine decarboxylase n=1 Tax=Marinitoga piezophila (strain DSM 14283 / JCM 11233 / KA3) TaxID=443254 RepID=H2J6K4_MARPK|nr:MULTISPECIES: type III PLP-dependent enzyme [Marinitoga]AEX85189.1 diaminopimelate decarboxylase [Marinitoga piezophila KA3]APT75682.1 ornithine decarboxylase [Marinitoga sp. 1137]NUU95423.1 ornithine decarboxylase [Marinitoga sp. 1135]NUU97350.1 ornithine decarboxylase [Marinitoga sp. 1138]